MTGCVRVAFGMTDGSRVAFGMTTWARVAFGMTTWARVVFGMTCCYTRADRLAYANKRACNGTGGHLRPLKTLRHLIRTYQLFSRGPYTPTALSHASDAGSI